MNTNEVENQVCEACGCAGEMGFIIKEGDDVSEVSIFAPTKAALEAELAKYVALAKEVCTAVKFESSDIADDSTELTARFQFEVSAEKLIFELKSRSLSR
ncbi:YfcZ/YiiS family protein [Vibrio agarivorans]|uniref:YfcZ/YiiS family protein n=1 Tax=Vibrio agarivorans TaxID=153622 RepID=UPI00222FA978|nr:YfcZ/YiiS family protein [Vibrio agarivorans]MDN3663617.1 YfcZ/YiiS family protein [Vibrio agarivorans]